MTGIIAGLVLLCVLVVVHELGHFLFAKALGVRVLTFSVGFGPRIWGFTRGGTEYRLSAIPLGGYIKMYGESLTEALSEDEKKYGFMHQPIWKKSLIAFAGPLFNFILPVILFFFIFLGNETVLLPVAGTVLPDEPAALAGLKPGDRILAVDGQSVEGFGDVVERVSAKPGQPLKLDIERKDTNGSVQRMDVTVVPSAEPNTHPLYKGESIGRIGIMPAIQKPQIVVSHPDSVAARAGLKTFDEILSIDGETISSSQQLLDALRQDPNKALQIKAKRLVDKGEWMTFTLLLPAQGDLKASFPLETPMKRFAVTEDELEDSLFQTQLNQTTDTLKEAEQQLFLQRGIAFIDGTLAGVEPDSTASELGLSRGDRIVAVDGKSTPTWAHVHKVFESAPDEHHIAGVFSKGQAYVMAFRLKPEAEKGSAYGVPPRKIFGHQVVDAYVEGPTMQHQVGVIEASRRAFARTGDLIWLTLKSLWMLVSFEVPMSQLGGPIMIFGVAGQAAAQGMAFYVYVMSLISVNLGLLNLLPIPVLDGGHLLLFGIEAVQRKPLSLRTRQIATQIGLMVMLALMAVAIFNDFARMFA